MMGPPHIYKKKHLEFGPLPNHTQTVILKSFYSTPFWIFLFEKQHNFNITMRNIGFVIENSGCLKLINIHKIQHKII